MYAELEFPLHAGGNVYCHGARSCEEVKLPLVLSATDPTPRIVEEDGKVFLSWRPGAELDSARSIPVTTDLLGRTAVADLPYENPDGSPLWIDVDLLGRERSKENPTPGPFESPQPVEQKLQLEGF